MPQQPNDIIEIPNPNPQIGSCPNCGKNIFASDKYGPPIIDMFKCIHCGAQLLRKEIIPF